MKYVVSERPPNADVRHWLRKPIYDAIQSTFGFALATEKGDVNGC